MRPAACHVVPEVSRSRSRRTMSFQPITARWYATEVPMIPPPTTTTRAWAGMLAGDELAAVTGSGCPAQKRDLGIILRVALRVLSSVPIRRIAESVLQPSRQHANPLGGAQVLRSRSQGNYG